MRYQFYIKMVKVPELRIKLFIVRSEGADSLSAGWLRYITLGHLLVSCYVNESHC